MDLALDRHLSESYHSKSQIARVLTQDWVERELRCLACSEQPLIRTPENTRSRDFYCESCEEPYELKSKSAPFYRWVADGEYGTLIDTVRSGRTPNLLLLQYDPFRLRVRGLDAIHRQLLSTVAIVPRNPLSSGAQRAGWQGCNIDLGLIPERGRVPIVRADRVIPWVDVRDAWAAYDFMVRVRPETQGWIRDVLAFARSLPSGPFRLQDIYQYERELREMHPGNRNIRPKIRQQLQVLVAQKVLERVRTGVYRFQAQVH